MAKKTSPTKNFTVRKAVAGDLAVLIDFLAKLALHVAGAPPQALTKAEQNRLRSTLAASLDDPDRFLIVAEIPDERLVGMACLYVCHNHNIWEQGDAVAFSSGFIDDVWVEPDFRNRGIFTAMLRELIGFAENRGINELMLEYSVSNKEAEATWTALGFQPTGVRVAAFTQTVKQTLNQRQ